MDIDWLYGMADILVLISSRYGLSRAEKIIHDL